MTAILLRHFAALALLVCSGLALPVDSEVPVESFADYGSLPGLNNTYKLHRELQHWGPAAQTCQNENGHLLVINDATEANGVFTLFSQVPNPGAGKQDLLHLGIYDTFSEGTWHVLTGGLLVELEYNLWETGKPTTSTSYNCGAINRAIHLTDIQCDTTTFNLPFVCEREAVSEASTTVAATTTDTTTLSTAIAATL